MATWYSSGWNVLYRWASTRVTRRPARVSREMADSPAKPAPQMTTWGAFGSARCLLAIVLTSDAARPPPPPERYSAAPDAHRFRATSSGRRHPWTGAGEGDGLGVLPAEVDWPGDGEAVGVAVAVGGGDVLAGTGELGASCVHAAMTTRSLAGSALPPTPLRSTK